MRMLSGEGIYQNIYLVARAAASDSPQPRNDVARRVLSVTCSIQAVEPPPLHLHGPRRRSRNV